MSLTVPERMRAARAVAEMSLDELADEIGTTRQRLSRWERGLDPIPPLLEPGVLAAVSKATGLPHDWFMEGAER